MAAPQSKSTTSSSFPSSAALLSRASSRGCEVSTSADATHVDADAAAAHAQQLCAALRRVSRAAAVFDTQFSSELDAAKTSLCGTRRAVSSVAQLVEDAYDALVLLDERRCLSSFRFAMDEEKRSAEHDERERMKGIEEIQKVMGELRVDVDRLQGTARTQKQYTRGTPSTHTAETVTWLPSRHEGTQGGLEGVDLHLELDAKAKKELDDFYDDDDEDF